MESADRIAAHDKHPGGLTVQITASTDLVQFIGIRVRVDRPAADGIPTPGTFTGVFVALWHSRARSDAPHARHFAGGTFDADPDTYRSGGRTSLAVPYGTTITTI